jgi:hypothetical protein
MRVVAIAVKMRQTVCDTVYRQTIFRKQKIYRFFEKTWNAGQEKYFGHRWCADWNIALFRSSIDQNFFLSLLNFIHY